VTDRTDAWLYPPEVKIRRIAVPVRLNPSLRMEVPLAFRFVLIMLADREIICAQSGSAALEIRQIMIVQSVKIDLGSRTSSLAGVLSSAASRLVNSYFLPRKGRANASVGVF